MTDRRHPCLASLHGSPKAAQILRLGPVWRRSFIPPRRLHSWQVWHQQRREMLSQLRSVSVDICGNRRCNWPGHSAKYLMYSILCTSLGIILRSEQIQAGEVISKKALCSISTKVVFVLILTLLFFALRQPTIYSKAYLSLPSDLLYMAHILCNYLTTDNFFSRVKMSNPGTTRKRKA